MNNILIVDDEQSMRELLSIMLKKEGYDVSTANNGEHALRAVQSEIFDLIITDIRMPSVNGIELLKSVKELSPETVVIVVTAFASTETAVDAMKLGAYDYITKPFKNEEIRLIVRKALEKRSLRKENLLLKRELEAKAGFENFVGRSDSMQKIFSLIRQVAETKSTVLITGESGTGKELVARAIHYSGTRKDHPFVAINCGALPEPLLESELFGCMKGAFTGAISNKEGLFEAANEGTIFLDEISTTSPALQIKLLRVLQTREFKRVGGTNDIRVDVRIIAASNRDLGQEISRGTFREDLYYRLNVIPINLPPLRERKEDIPVLIDYFLKKLQLEVGGNRKMISPESVRRLTAYHWPGNVRELENAMERLYTLATGDLILPEHIANTILQGTSTRALIPETIPVEGINLEQILESVEKTLLHKAMETTGGVKTEAAKLLQLTFRSFRHRWQKYERP